MLGAYHNICAAWDEEFARNRQLHGDRIQCRAGCSDCCSQLFQITEPEAGVISRGVAGFDAGTRADLQSRATRYLAARQELVAGLGSFGKTTQAAAEEAWGSLPPPGARLACPALSDQGECRIYEYRPLICRKFGVPLWNPDRPGRVYACELNFKAGEAIEDPALIQIQTGLHQEWKRLQNDYNQQSGRRDPNPLTIARAILEDFGTLVW